MVSYCPSPLQSSSMKPLPLVSLEVSMRPLWLRSMHAEGSLAILVTDDWPPKARLEMKRSPLKSADVRRVGDPEIVEDGVRAVELEVAIGVAVDAELVLGGVLHGIGLQRELAAGRAEAHLLAGRVAVRIAAHVGIADTTGVDLLDP